MGSIPVVLALSFMLSCTFGDSNFSDTEILEWKAPEYLKNKYPYYISGHDRDGSPVFAFEAGKWDLRSVVEAGPEMKEEFDKYVTQMMLRWRFYGNEATGSPGTVVIVDMDGMDLTQLGHVGVVQLILKQFPKFHQLTQLPGMKKAYVINAIYLFERVFEFGKPLLGAAANLVEMYGTNAAKWKPILLRDIPATELPAWYGGSKSHTAVKVFGK